MQEFATHDYRLLSIPAAAEKLGVSEYAMRSLISEKRIPTVQVGKRRRVPAFGLEAFVHTCDFVDESEGEAHA